MSNSSPFPEKPQTLLSIDEVINFLVEQQQRGYQIFQVPKRNGVFDLILDDASYIRFNGVSNGKMQVQSFSMHNIVNFVNCTSLLELRRAVDALANALIGTRWQHSPSSARVSEDTPATNLVTISGLIGSSAVEAIFDPYLENRSLANLINILSFGSGTVANGVRVLSTNKTTRGNVPRLTRPGFDAWTAQLGISGEIRVMESSEHRRFLLLSGSQSLLLGHSLNAIDKNEAVRVEPDTQDRVFFDQVWATANVLS